MELCTTDTNHIHMYMIIFNSVTKRYNQYHQVYWKKPRRVWWDNFCTPTIRQVCCDLHTWLRGGSVIYSRDYSRKVARRVSSRQVLLHVCYVSFTYTVRIRVCGQLRSSSQTPLNLISRGLACTCRNFKGEPHRLRRRRFARETGTCTSPLRSSLLVFFHLILNRLTSHARIQRDVIKTSALQERTESKFAMMVRNVHNK